MGTDRRATAVLLALGMAVAAVGCARRAGDAPGGKGRGAAEFVGSASCRACHEVFYRRWATSRHGLALQPFTAALGDTILAGQTATVAVGAYRYRAVVAGGSPCVIETGPEGERKYPIAYALGGKNVFYFLTPRERGRLQVLPVAYDVRGRQWFDLVGSGVRHFPGERGEPPPERWTSTQLTFNTSCFSCHVSQLERGYDLATNAYRTLWREPGINCETCHGPAGRHVRRFESARRGSPPEDLAIVVTRRFSHAQKNALCAPCHARMSALTPTFRPGEPYFDNFDLVTLEDEDFYPDGRDRGENYTQTQWLLSPCARSGGLDCLHCHTSSGRFRQAAHPDSSCAPCHGDKVADPPAHTRHRAESPGSRCVSCHMPRTEFARMARHDHSMRPPAPAASLAFGSPNACNLCHADRDARWADRVVRRWRVRDYQAPELARASLVAAARRRDWAELPRMLAYLTRATHDEVYEASLLRLLGPCEAAEKWPVAIRALGDPSPLVRSSAASALAGHFTAEAITALLAATGDPVRLVRVRAAAALASLPRDSLGVAARRRLEAATDELVSALGTRPDDYRSQNALGNFYLDRGEASRAVASFETAMRQAPESAPVRINAAAAYGAAGRDAEAEGCLREALRLAPQSAVARLDLGLLLQEKGRTEEAESELREALAKDPRLAEAAYNLALLLSGRMSAEAVHWGKRAVALRPGEVRYAYALAYLERQAGDTGGAIEVLRALLRRHRDHAEAYLLLGETYESLGRIAEARALYRGASGVSVLPASDRARLLGRWQALAGR